jgi:two-component system, NarL family, response regulator DesR
MIRVLLVDDHPAILGGVAGALAAEPDIVVVAKATSLAAARDALAEHDPDVALLDIRLPDGSGLDLLRGGKSRPAFIIFSTFDYPQYVARAVRSGATGFILKSAPMPEVVAAIRRAAAGLTTFPAPFIEVAAATHPLTPRQATVIRALGEGRSNGEIATLLGLAKKTVEGYLSQLYAEFDVTSRAELVARAVREGWLD